MLLASAGIGSRKNICPNTQAAGQAFTACPAAFSARILENVFFVYGGSTVELLPMFYSSSSSDHEEIM